MMPNLSHLPRPPTDAPAAADPPAAAPQPAPADGTWPVPSRRAPTETSVASGRRGGAPGRPPGQPAASGQWLGAVTRGVRVIATTPSKPSKVLIEVGHGEDLEIHIDESSGAVGSVLADGGGSQGGVAAGHAAPALPGAAANEDEPGRVVSEPLRPVQRIDAVLPPRSYGNRHANQVVLRWVFRGLGAIIAVLAAMALLNWTPWSNDASRTEPDRPATDQERHPAPER